METSAPEDKTVRADFSASLSTSRLLVLVFACFVLSAIALAVDMPVMRWMDGHELPGDLRRLVHLSEVFGWGGTVWLIILTAGVLDRRGWRVAIPLAVSSLGAGLAANGIKLLVGRLRPRAADDMVTIWDSFVGFLPTMRSEWAGMSSSALQSFPSAHAATAAGLALGLALSYPRGRWLFAFFALLAMFQRMYGLSHWCSDVLAGAALGLLVAAGVQRRICSRLN